MRSSTLQAEKPSIVLKSCTVAHSWLCPFSAWLYHTSISCCVIGLCLHPCVSFPGVQEGEERAAKRAIKKAYVRVGTS